MESQENIRAKSYAAIPCFCSPYGPGGDTEGNPRRRPAARENLVAIARRKRRRSDVDSEFSVHVGVVVNQPAKYHEMNLEYAKENVQRNVLLTNHQETVLPSCQMEPCGLHSSPR